MATIGDADQLRRTAAALDDRAAELSGLAHRIESQTSGMVYAGPAADDFRAQQPVAAARIGVHLSLGRQPPERRRVQDAGAVPGERCTPPALAVLGAFVDVALGITHR